MNQPPFAWQPLTPAGVGTFARATAGRVLLVQLVFALLSAGVVVWFLQNAWLPVVTEAINRLPPGGQIRYGQLHWPAESPMPLAEGRFLAFAVDLDHQGQARSPAYLCVEFGRTGVRIFSLFGFLDRAYPRGWIIAFNRAELEPWWGAWAVPLLGLAAVAVMAGLLLMWPLLAALYALPIWLLGFFANRDLSLAGSWRLAGAALMPGALFMAGTIVVFGLGALDVVRLLLAAAAHFLIGWLYCVVGTLSLPRHPGVPPTRFNPFKNSPPTQAAPGPTAPPPPSTAATPSAPGAPDVGANVPRATGSGSTGQSAG